MAKIDISNMKIVLGVGGSIAAYKSVDLLRQLVKIGADVKVIMSRNAVRFLSPVVFETLSMNPVTVDLFDGENFRGVSHVELASFAEAVILAPATANMIGKIANGIADDAMSTFMLAVTCPVMICPAMNSDMYEHPATQKNLTRIKLFDYFVLTGHDGELACGVSGPGRLPEPFEIVDRLSSYLTSNDMDSKRVLVTAGPTREFIDPVRFISNLSSGKMGYSIARAAENRGADVTLISGPTSIKVPMNVDFIRVVSAKEMEIEVFRKLFEFDIVIKVAAVSDYGPENFVPEKIKKVSSTMVLKLKKNVDILAKVSSERSKEQIIVGFAAETFDLESNARKKLIEKKLDMLVANLVCYTDFGFSSENNLVTLFFPNGKEEVLDLMSKDSLAHVLLDRVMKIDL